MKKLILIAALACVAWAPSFDPSRASGSPRAESRGDGAQRRQAPAAGELAAWEQRAAAFALSRALREGATHADPDAVLATATKILDDEPGVRVDYLALTGTDLGPAPGDGPARLLVAAKVGATRLIDNVPLRLAKGR